MQKNKNKLFFLTAILMPLIVDASQEKKVEGYFISNNNDTVKTYLYFTFWGDDFSWFSDGVKYLDSTNKKQFLKPEGVKELGFIYKEKKIKLLSKKYLGSYLFLKIIDNSGYVKFYYSAIGKFGSDVLQKGNDTLFFTNGLHRQNKLMQYFSDCPDLAQKIKEGKIESTLEMVKEYNQSCAKK